MLNSQDNHCQLPKKYNTIINFYTCDPSNSLSNSQTNAQLSPTLLILVFIPLYPGSVLALTLFRFAKSPTINSKKP